MIVGGSMEELIKIEFDVLSYDDVVDLLSWSVFAEGGALPLKDVSYDYYPQLREIEKDLEANKESKSKVVELIHQDLEKVYRKYYNHSKKMVKRYGLIWEKYNDNYVKALADYFNIEWPEGHGDITAYIGRIPVCPRFIRDNSFYIDFLDADTLVDVCMHELCHFMFFIKCHKLFPNQKIEYDNESLFWYMSEIVIDPILNSNIFKRLFKHKFRSYEHFYSIKFGKEMMMDKIHLIFNNNKIDDAMIECYEYLRKNEYELRKQCGDTEKDEVIEVRMN